MTGDIRIGAHVSIAGSIDQSIDRAKTLGCKTFQIFTRNPRGWHSKPLTQSESDAFRSKLNSANISPAVAHMPYLPNLSSPSSETHEKSVKTLTAELGRCGQLGIPYLVTHLGSHMGNGFESGLKQIARAVNEALSADRGGTVLLIENTAGTKNSMGSTFEELRNIVDELKFADRVGVCLDTAHAFAAGYDLRTEAAVARTMSSFDSSLKASTIKVVHLNDSVVTLGGGRDRHEHIGLGCIGEDGFRAILRDPDLRLRPLILETPVDGRRGSREEIAKARELA